VAKKIIVRMDGRPRQGDIAEYCVSEGWARVWLRNARGQFMRERGKPRTVKHHCKLEVVWKPGVTNVEHAKEHV
jgi:hypothetical protein